MARNDEEVEVAALIHRDSSVPLYQQFYDLLKKALDEGLYPPGTNLPPERELCALYRIDRTTVRRAMKILADEGRIKRVQGRGTVVLDPPDQNGNLCVLFALYHSKEHGERIGETFYTATLDALDSYLHARGHRLMYCMLHPNDSIPEILDRFQAKGLILAGRVDVDLISKCAALKVPVVFYNNRIANLSCVSVDNGGGAEMAVQHLLKLGHRKIGFIHVPDFPNSKARLIRFQSVLSQRSDGSQLVVTEGDWTEMGGYQATRALFEREPGLTALFTGNDNMALGALHALREMGRRVPEDVSVVGFDGITKIGAGLIPLTTVKVDIPLMAEGACMLLFHLMAPGARTGMHIVAPTELSDRGSTAVPDQTTK